MNVNTYTTIPNIYSDFSDKIDFSLSLSKDLTDSSISTKESLSHFENLIDYIFTKEKN